MGGGGSRCAGKVGARQRGAILVLDVRNNEQHDGHDRPEKCKLTDSEEKDRRISGKLSNESNQRKGVHSHLRVREVEPAGDGLVLLEPRRGPKRLARDVVCVERRDEGVVCIIGQVSANEHPKIENAIRIDKAFRRCCFDI